MDSRVLSSLFLSLIFFSYLFLLHFPGTWERRVKLESQVWHFVSIVIDSSNFLIGTEADPITFSSLYIDITGALSKPSLLAPDTTQFHSP
ncbi:hypothetical protein BDN70DRAFT_884711 [Pholiota conissans]|uniref:Uncharacterized protein n=1 Tax=Pholiota conissans TaxID=109636 RepID=A0A9P5YTW3_9AGAR|nr:hypothetical protein BDN70DRAFT_884711 [Pholiota conissans]